MLTVQFDKPNEHVIISSPGFVRADIVFWHSAVMDKLKYSTCVISM